MAASKDSTLPESDVDSTLPESDVAQIEEIYEKEGASGLRKFIIQKVDGWKYQTVNLAVIGRSGVGKSSFINAYRNIEFDDDVGAAKTGVKQTTMEATPYPDPNNENIVLYDLPGVGTKEFPRKTYLTDPRIKFKKFDVFILLTSDRFTEDDCWLAKQIKRAGRTCLFARTKFWQDVENEKRTKREFQDKTDDEIVNSLRDIALADMRNVTQFDRVYMIDSHKRTHHLLDFDDLLDAIANALSGLKREAVINALDIHTPKILAQKISQLSKRIKFVCLLSGSVALVPVPGASFTFDHALVNREKEMFRKQLGLDETTMSLLQTILNSDTSMRLIQYIQGISGAIQSTHVPILLASEGIENAVKFIPVVGFAASFVLSSSSTYYVLRKYLNEMGTAAKDINTLLSQTFREGTETRL